MGLISRLAAGASLIGSGISAASQIRQGRAAQSAANYNSAVAESNADLIRSQGRQEAILAENQAAWQRYNQRVVEQSAQARIYEAEELRRTSEENIRRRRDDNRRLVSRMRATIAKSGVSLEGSPIDVMAKTAARLELEAQEIAGQARAGIERLFYESELTKAGARAVATDVALTRFRGRNAISNANRRADLALAGADLGQSAAQSTARASTFSAAGTLLSGGARALRYLPTPV